MLADRHHGALHEPLGHGLIRRRVGGAADHLAERVIDRRRHDHLGAQRRRGLGHRHALARDALELPHLADRVGAGLLRVAHRRERADQALERRAGPDVHDDQRCQRRVIALQVLLAERVHDALGGQPRDTTDPGRQRLGAHERAGLLGDGELAGRASRLQRGGRALGVGARARQDQATRHAAGGGRRHVADQRHRDQLGQHRDGVDDLRVLELAARLVERGLVAAVAQRSLELRLGGVSGRGPERGGLVGAGALARLRSRREGRALDLGERGDERVALGDDAVEDVPLQQPHRDAARDVELLQVGRGAADLLRHLIERLEAMIEGLLTGVEGEVVEGGLRDHAALGDLLIVLLGPVDQRALLADGGVARLRVEFPDLARRLVASSDVRSGHVDLEATTHPARPLERARAPIRWQTRLPQDLGVRVDGRRPGRRRGLAEDRGQLRDDGRDELLLGLDRAGQAHRRSVVLAAGELGDPLPRRGDRRHDRLHEQVRARHLALALLDHRPRALEHRQVLARHGRQRGPFILGVGRIGRLVGAGRVPDPSDGLCQRFQLSVASAVAVGEPLLRTFDLGAGHVELLHLGAILAGVVVERIGEVIERMTERVDLLRRHVQARWALAEGHGAVHQIRVLGHAVRGAGDRRRSSCRRVSGLVLGGGLRHRRGLDAQEVVDHHPGHEPIDRDDGTQVMVGDGEVRAKAVALGGISAVGVVRRDVPVAEASYRVADGAVKALGDARADAVDPAGPAAPPRRQVRAVRWGRAGDGVAVGARRGSLAVGVDDRPYVDADALQDLRQRIERIARVDLGDQPHGLSADAPIRVDVAQALGKRVALAGEELRDRGEHTLAQVTAQVHPRRDCLAVARGCGQRRVDSRLGGFAVRTLLARALRVVIPGWPRQIDVAGRTRQRGAARCRAGQFISLELCGVAADVLLDRELRLRLMKVLVEDDLLARRRRRVDVGVDRDRVAVRDAAGTAGLGGRAAGLADLEARGDAELRARCRREGVQWIADVGVRAVRRGGAIVRGRRGVDVDVGRRASSGTPLGRLLSIDAFGEEAGPHGREALVEQAVQLLGQATHLRPQLAALRERGPERIQVAVHELVIDDAHQPLDQLRAVQRPRTVGRRQRRRKPAHA